MTLVERFTQIYNLLPNSLSLGIMWGAMALGVFITYKILEIADLTVEGTFAMGGCITAQMISKNINPIFAILVSMVGGLIAGAITGVLHTKFKIPAILSGILTMLALYSVNFKIMDGSSNIRMSDLGTRKVDTILDHIGRLVGLDKITQKSYIELIFGVLIIAIIIGALYWFFGTELGSALRATGNNEHMVRALGVSTDTMKIIGLALSNGIVALAGSMVAQAQRFGDVGMGMGTIVTGLAAIVIGEVIFGKNTPFLWRLATVIIGSTIFQIVRSAVLAFDMNPDDLQLLTSVIVAIALFMPVGREQIKKQINNHKNKKLHEGV